ncbi:hypothetical protein [Streptomyces sp. NPDC047061]|uniref:hypothetical protein n=1 Tax=Streptomyces sp. NPDC047061 TaxID=3154605 RepID=UPI0033D0E092
MELPLSDFSRASGIDLGDDTMAKQLAARRAEISRYLTAHLRPTTLQGKAWIVAFGDIVLSQAEKAATAPTAN